jgi:general secretion pathway protein G
MRRTSFPPASTFADPVAASISGARRPARKGFTLIELLVVMSIVAILLTIAVPRYFSGVDQSREVVLKQNLIAVREAIDKFHADSGAFPESIEALVEKRYLKSLPVDPVTESTGTWLIIAPEPPHRGKVFDIRSGAPGTAQDGSEYRTW